MATTPATSLTTTERYSEPYEDLMRRTSKGKPGWALAARMAGYLRDLHEIS